MGREREEVLKAFIKDANCEQGGGFGNQRNCEATVALAKLVLQLDVDEVVFENDLIDGVHAFADKGLDRLIGRVDNIERRVDKLE